MRGYRVKEYRAAPHWNVLWRRQMRPLLTASTVRVLRSCVELVTVAVTPPALSVSMMMRLLLSCSWISTTFSAPCRPRARGASRPWLVSASARGRRRWPECWTAAGRRRARCERAGARARMWACMRGSGGRALTTK